MSNIVGFHRGADLKMLTTRKTFVNLVVRMVSVWPSKKHNKTHEDNQDKVHCLDFAFLAGPVTNSNSLCRNS